MGDNAAYNFKTIKPVPTSEDLVNIVLSQTQRKTPTQVHPQFKISRIRSFYMRKVKYAQQTFHDKLTEVVSRFPKIDEINPFYKELLDTKFGRDHFKLALAQCNVVRGSVDTIAKDYVKLLKYADSPFKCKSLKRAALGRMSSMCKKLSASLIYLEQVRQQMMRMPAINPSTPALVLAGFPNVGKSSFMNLVSRANVEVQPFAFTTKNLYVGHFEYDLVKWQVVDTPGVLDRPLSERNPIEMHAVWAMFHLSAAILFFVDLSETCGYSLLDQIALFDSFKASFEQQEKPIVIVLNKIDLRPPSELSDEEKLAIERMRDGMETCSVHFVACSSLKNEGVEEAKLKACESLTAHIEQKKIQTKHYSTLEAAKPFTADVMVRADRTPHIPASLLQRKQTVEDISDPLERDQYLEQLAAMRKLERDLEEECGGAGVYQSDDRKRYLLENQEWIRDRIPEIYEGKNISDFIDIQLDDKLRALEEEELLLEQMAASEKYNDEEILLAKKILKEISDKSNLGKLKTSLKHLGNASVPRRKLISLDTLVKEMRRQGLNPDGLIAAAKAPAKSIYNDSDEELSSDEEEQMLEDRENIKMITDEDDINMTSSSVIMPYRTLKGVSTRIGPYNKKNYDALVYKVPVHTSRHPATIDPKAANLELEARVERRLRDLEISRSRSKLGVKKRRLCLSPNRLELGSGGNKKLMRLSESIQKKVIKTAFKKSITVNEGDRHIADEKPKHLFTGKRGIGKTDRR